MSTGKMILGWSDMRACKKGMDDLVGKKGEGETRFENGRQR